MRFLILFALLYSIVVFNSNWNTDIDQHNQSQKLFSFHKPSSFSNSAINHYSVVHFFQYAALSFLKFFKLVHILIISIIWEIFELYTHFEWGRESWMNKVFDIGFNIAGFQFGRRKLINLLNKKPS